MRRELDIMTNHYFNDAQIDLVRNSVKEAKENSIQNYGHLLSEINKRASSKRDGTPMVVDRFQVYRQVIKICKEFNLPCKRYKYTQ